MLKIDIIKINVHFLSTRGQQRFPQKEAYDIGEIFTDLLNFAVKFLEVGGHLVYWLPIYRPE